ncbi:MAG: 7-cyano-7-deazaguanine synthase QueC [Candidatus Heimdallarchaeota archaeon]|nr:7-cyano-7-deazaguanine synthase QueC [Candidatus Heimdallarchaeota archaeon]MCK4768937.1 7-cyano-7-deazaguanine synthase QueC [Candidatus Heimdallarchaeota archaeon]
MSIAIVLFSGGLDSTACVYWALDRYEKIILLSLLYGSKEDEVIERVNQKYSSLLSLEGKIITIPFLGEFAKSAGSKLSKGETEPPSLSNFSELDRKTITNETMKQVWVPGRNILLLSIAASFADSMKEPVDIIFGANLEEGETFPDNTKEFVDKMNEALTFGCMNKVRIQAPFHDLLKNNIVDYLEKIGANLEFSSSCYSVEDWSNDGKPIHCGKCESCLRRKRAFSNAEISDKTLYK